MWIRKLTASKARCSLPQFQLFVTNFTSLWACNMYVYIKEAQGVKSASSIIDISISVDMNLYTATRAAAKAPPVYTEQFFSATAKVLSLSLTARALGGFSQKCGLNMALHNMFCTFGKVQPQRHSPDTWHTYQPWASAPKDERRPPTYRARTDNCGRDWIPYSPGTRQSWAAPSASSVV